MEEIVLPNKLKELVKINSKDFKKHAILCFLILNHTGHLPLDVVRYIISMFIIGRKFDYKSDFDSNGILYYLGTKGLTEESYKVYLFKSNVNIL